MLQYPMRPDTAWCGVWCSFVAAVTYEKRSHRSCDVMRLRCGSQPQYCSRNAWCGLQFKTMLTEPEPASTLEWDNYSFLLIFQVTIFFSTNLKCSFVCCFYWFSITIQHIDYLPNSINKTILNLNLIDKFSSHGIS